MLPVPESEDSVSRLGVLQEVGAVAAVHHGIAETEESQRVESR